MSDTASLEGIFVRNYDRGSQIFEEQQNLKAKSWKKFKVSPLKPSADGVYSVVSMSGNEAGGAQNENEGFQQAGSLDPVQPKIQAKNVMWPFEVTGRAINLSATNTQAFATAIDSQQKDNIKRMFSDLNRQSLGIGTGQMSLVNGAGVATNTIVVDNAIPFRRGMRIDILVTLAGAKEVSGALITAVDYTTKTLTISTNETFSDNSIITKIGQRDGVAAGQLGKELTGIRAIANDVTLSADFQGVPIASNPEWVGNIVDGLNSPVSQDLLQQLRDRNEIIGGGTCDWLVSGHGQKRIFINTEIQKTRYEPTKIEAGTTVLKWDDLEWFVDKDYEPFELGMYCSEYLEKFQCKDPEISKISGLSYYQVNGFDKIGGYYAYYGDIGTWKRNAHGRLINLTEPDF
jgi:hypothetical protein